MKADPGQVHNLLAKHPNGTQSLPSPLKRTVDRLDALTLVLKSCKGETCTHPWEALHPDGNVKTFADAMDCKYDEFYANQPKISFDECSYGYIIDIEGPQDHNVYGEEWSFWE